MHELALSQSILDLVIDVAKKNNAQKILKIILKVGELSCVNLDSLQFAFSCISQGTLAEGAELLVSSKKERSLDLEIESIEVD